MEKSEFETLKKIADVIEYLPTDELFSPTFTQDQKNEWEKTRKFQCLLASEWRSRYNISPQVSYPIESACDRGEITKAKANILLLSVEEHQKRWELIKVAEPLLRDKHKILQEKFCSPPIKNALSKPIMNKLFDNYFWYKLEQEYPFQSDFELFTHILIEEANYTFSSCLDNYCEISSKKMHSFLHHILEIIKSDSDESNSKMKDWKKIKGNLVWLKTFWNWWAITLFICQYDSSKNPIIKDKLIDYKKCFHECMKKAKSESRKLPSKAWKNGKLLHGAKQGGIYE